MRVQLLRRTNRLGLSRRTLHSLQAGKTWLVPGQDFCVRRLLFSLSLSVALTEFSASKLLRMRPRWPYKWCSHQLLWCRGPTASRLSQDVWFGGHSFKGHWQYSVCEHALSRGRVCNSLWWNRKLLVEKVRLVSKRKWHQYASSGFDSAWPFIRVCDIGNFP